MLRFVGEGKNREDSLVGELLKSSFPLRTYKQRLMTRLRLSAKLWHTYDVVYEFENRNLIV